MWQWKRSKPDPMTRLFVERYGLHLIRQPRADVAVGDVYPVKDGDTGQPGRLEYLVSPAPALPECKMNEAMADVAGATSDTVEAETGAGFLDSFFAALGAVGFQGKLKADMAAKQASGVQFRFSGATRDYADPFAIERKLKERQVNREASLLKPDYRYYLVTGVVRTNQITFSVFGSGSGKISVDVEALSIANVNSGISTQRGANEEVTVSGNTRLAFAVQLNEININNVSGRLELTIPTGPVATRSSGPGKVAGYSRIGGPDASIFL
jgi:hypothetical protein